MTELDDIRGRTGVMRRYLTMLIVAMMLAVWVPIMMSPWLIVGPWRLANRLRGRLWLMN